MTKGKAKTERMNISQRKVPGRGNKDQRPVHRGQALIVYSKEVKRI